MLSLLATAARSTSSPGASLWQVIAAVAVVVGLLAGIQQLTASVRRRTFRQEEERVFAAAAMSLDAEAAQRDYKHYEALRHLLRQQVEDEVPREAMRVYLTSRADALAQQIQRDVDEYEHVQRELGRASRSAPRALDERLRNVIENAIQPAYLRRRNTDRAVLTLLVALIALSVTPVSPRSLVDGYFGVVDSSTDYLDSAVVNVVGIAVLVVTAAMVVAARWFLRRRTVWKASRRLVILSISALVAGLAAVVGGWLARQASLDSYNAVAPDYAAVEQRELTAAGLFDVAVVLLGFGFGLLVALVSLRWSVLMSWMRGLRLRWR